MDLPDHLSPSGDAQRLERGFAEAVRAALYNADIALGLGLPRGTVEQLAAYLPGFVTHNFAVAWKPRAHHVFLQLLTEDLAPHLVGRTVEEARSLADACGVLLRVDVDGTAQTEQPFDVGRITVELSEGRVVASLVG